MTGFELDPSVFPGVAAQLEQQRAVIAEQTQVVSSYASGQGNPWGGDEAGSAFGAIYADVLNHVSEVMSSHADLLDYAAQELRSWADDAVMTDDDVASKLSTLGGGG